MEVLEQVRDGLNRAWDTLADGWRELRERAADALTHFHLPATGGQVETRDERAARGGARWGFLAAEISNDDQSVEVSVEVPGMEPGDFDVQVKHDVLIIRGEKRMSRHLQRGQYSLMQCAYGRFERVLPLPAPVNDENARASYKRGILHLSLPKVETARRKRIPVGS